MFFDTWWDNKPIKIWKKKTIQSLRILFLDYFKDHFRTLDGFGFFLWYIDWPFVTFLALSGHYLNHIWTLSGIFFTLLHKLFCDESLFEAFLNAFSTFKAQFMPNTLTRIDHLAFLEKNNRNGDALKIAIRIENRLKCKLQF